MSSTRRSSSARDPFDYYPTQPWMVHRLLERLSLPRGAWVDPCAGDGAILRAVGFAFQDWSAFDIQPRFEPVLQSLNSAGRGVYVVIEDFLKYPPEKHFRAYAVGITNPPFSIATEVVARMLTGCVHAIVLQRLNWLAGPRADIFRNNMPDLYVLPDRPAFDERGADSIEYAWFHWGIVRGRSFGEIKVLDSTPVQVRREERKAAIAMMRSLGVPARSNGAPDVDPGKHSP